jgi:hypothetical protein
LALDLRGGRRDAASPRPRSAGCRRCPRRPSSATRA